MADALNVWMNGQLVGRWSHTRSKTSLFQYAPDWMRSPAARALSLSMPMTAGNGEHRGKVVENYFDNLLPENEAIRQRLRSRFATQSTQAFELLTAIGRDCVGAVQLLPVNSQPDGWDKVQSAPMTQAQVAAALRAASTDLPLGQRHPNEMDFRISIAGAQEKTALLRYGGKWRRPLGATPTTHILKLPLGLVGNMRADLWDSVENEWLCAKILKALGFKVAQTEMACFEDQKALVVERFDRRWQNIDPGEQNAPGYKPDQDVWIARLPQEDFCQIAGVAPSKKYETDGGPGIPLCLAHLGGSVKAKEDRAQFVLTQLAFWLLAATDGHAKNFSAFLHRGGGYSLTPLYDVLSAWPIIGKGANMLARQDAKLAMAMHSRSTHYKLAEIRARHFKALAESCGADDAWQRMLNMVEGVGGALQLAQGQLPADFPEKTWHRVSAGIKQHAEQFKREVISSRA
jgi:serine/threonine-protein kinase HipA